MISSEGGKQASVGEGDNKNSYDLPDTYVEQNDVIVNGAAISIQLNILDTFLGTD
jgi:hypothetical protein